MPPIFLQTDLKSAICFQLTIRPWMGRKGREGEGGEGLGGRDQEGGTVYVYVE